MDPNRFRPAAAPSRSAVSAVGWVLLTALLAVGCIRRELSIVSEPAGASLVINGQAAGVTPAKLRFRHHGTYRVEVRKTGYEPIVDALKLSPHLYERMPFDLAFGLLWPGTIRDHRKVHYRLRKLPPFDRRKLLSRALRAGEEAARVIPELYEAPKPKPETPARALPPDSRLPEEKWRKPKSPDAPGPGKGGDK
ncbi:MAG: PEGA domain-containing protein [Planctomycetota bacterium]|jgi:hypothetical protein